MSETPPEATPPADPAAQPSGADAAAEPADTTDWKAEARKWEQRAKENKQARDDLDKQRKAAMTEAERAVAEAEARGRTAAVSEYGQRLARADFNAQASRRNPGYDVAPALEFVDLGKFIGEDGEPDSKAIAAAVERLVPEASNTPPSFDGGSRQAAPANTSMSGLIRKAAGRA